jgi:hypothetical protein
MMSEAGALPREMEKTLKYDTSNLKNVSEKVYDSVRQQSVPTESEYAKIFVRGRSTPSSEMVKQRTVYSVDASKPFITISVADVPFTREEPLFASRILEAVIPAVDVVDV